MIHETTPGPFDRGDTLWAPWCPSDQDISGCKKFTSKLERSIKKFKLSN